jgi:uncharacterized membrane protein YphA (DoxX/SURF4 family)
MGVLYDLVRRVAQALLAVVFVKGGFDSSRNPGARTDKAASLGLSNAETLVRLNGAAMALGGAALALDKVPRLAAAGLVASMVPTTVAGHPFWKLDGPERDAQLTQFGKNLGLIGGLLLVVTAKRR